MHSWLENVKAVAEIMAYLSAALFLAYKVYSGWFITDLSIKLECRRDRSSKLNADYLGATVTVKKGERGAIQLHDLRVTVFDGSGGQMRCSQEARGLRRLGIVRPDDKIEQQPGEIRADVVETGRNRLLNLAPGDEMQFAALFEVAADQSCVVEAVLLGRRFFPFTVRRRSLQRLLRLMWSQWRASSVSPPLSRP